MCLKEGDEEDPGKADRPVGSPGMVFGEPVPTPMRAPPLPAWKENVGRTEGCLGTRLAMLGTGDVCEPAAGWASAGGGGGIYALPRPSD